MMMLLARLRRCAAMAVFLFFSLSASSWAATTTTTAAAGGVQYLLSEAGQCEDLAGCRSATSRGECGEFITHIQNASSKPVQAAIKPAPQCYLYAPGQFSSAAELGYFNDGEAQPLSHCSSVRKCVCRCSQQHPGSTAPMINVALYTGTGDTTRGHNNAYTVLNYAADMRVLNFTALDVKRHLDSGVYDVVVFPGGETRGQDLMLGAEGLAAVRTFLSHGKGYLGICAGAFLALNDRDLGISFAKDGPLPKSAPAEGRGDGNCTVALTTEGTRVRAPATGH
jgi:hypothetical protein